MYNVNIFFWIVLQYTDIYNSDMKDSAKVMPEVYMILARVTQNLIPQCLKLICQLKSSATPPKKGITYSIH